MMAASDEAVPLPVLAGVGQTWQADDAVRWALEEARSRSVGLHLVRACGPTAAERDDADDILAETVRRCHRLAPQVDVVAEVVEADPVWALTSRSADSCLVVVGTSARGPLGTLMGSVGSTLTGSLGVPVVLVRGEHGRERPPDWPVLAAVRSAEDADRVLEHACAAARRDGRPLVVVHALQPGPGVPMVPGVDRQRMDCRSWLSAAVWRWRERVPDVRVRVEIAVDAADRAVRERSAHCALVVLGVRRAGWAGGLWRHIPPLPAISRPLELVAAEASHCPVALVPLTSATPASLHMRKTSDLPGGNDDEPADVLRGALAR